MFNSKTHFNMVSWIQTKITLFINTLLPITTGAFVANTLESSLGGFDAFCPNVTFWNMPAIAQLVVARPNVLLFGAYVVTLAVRPKLLVYIALAEVFFAPSAVHSIVIKEAWMAHGGKGVKSVGYSWITLKSSS